MYAAFNNHPACVKLLLEYGADLTLKNEDDYMVMDLAVGQGHKAGKLLVSLHTLFILTYAHSHVKSTSHCCEKMTKSHRIR